MWDYLYFYCIWTLFTAIYRRGESSSIRVLRVQCWIYGAIITAYTCSINTKFCDSINTFWKFHVCRTIQLIYNDSILRYSIDSLLTLLLNIHFFIKIIDDDYDGYFADHHSWGETMITSVMMTTSMVEISIHCIVCLKETISQRDLRNLTTYWVHLY